MSWRGVIGPACLALVGACGGAASEAPAAGEPSPRERIEAALPAYLAAIGRAPRAPSFNAQRSALAAGRAAQAIAELEPLSATDPSGEAAFLLAWAHYGEDRYALAIEPLLRALDAGPGYPQAEHAFFFLGRCLQERGDGAGARAAFEADLALRPESGQARFRLAQLALEAGDEAACERYAREALESFERPRDRAKTHALLGDLHRLRGDPAAARAAFERCVALFPHYEVFYKLSRVCDQLEDAQAAEQYLELHQRFRAQAGR